MWLSSYGVSLDVLFGTQSQTNPFCLSSYLDAPDRQTDSFSTELELSTTGSSETRLKLHDEIHLFLKLHDEIHFMSDDSSSCRQSDCYRCLELVRTHVGISCLWRDSQAHHDACIPFERSLRAVRACACIGLLLRKTPRGLVCHL